MVGIEQYSPIHGARLLDSAVCLCRHEPSGGPVNGSGHIQTGGDEHEGPHEPQRDIDHATPDDNETSRDLTSLLPRTLTLEDRH